MTARSDAIPAHRRVTLTEHQKGQLIATRPKECYRFLLAGGDVVDVLADRDDSDLRVAILDYTGAERIDGVTIIGDRT